MTTNTINNQPTYSSLQTTDYILIWQGSQSPSTRKLPVSGLATYYANIGTTNTYSALQTFTSGFTANAASIINGATFPNFLRGYIGGLTLSNDGVTPNSVLDISAGVAMDSTNVTPIVIANNFTKTTGGSWTAGSGNAGMGQGLTIATSTWYHVFAIINSGAADVYFDTSVSASNAPSSTTAIRRIGSFLTDGSAHIIAFYQNGEEFYWASPVNNISGVVGSTTAHTAIITVPTGVVVSAILSGQVQDSGNGVIYISSPSVSDLAASATVFTTQAFGGAIGTFSDLRILTNTSNSIRYRSSTSTADLIVNTNGWVDTRGAFA